MDVDSNDASVIIGDDELRALWGEAGLCETVAVRFCPESDREL